MNNLPRINCQNVLFSPELASNRITHACQLFGTGVVRRVICWGLYLLGVDRTSISRILHIRLDTAKSLLKAIQRDGLPALEDRRRNSSSFLPTTVESPPEITVHQSDVQVVIRLNNIQQIAIPKSNPLQLRIVILSLLKNQLISADKAAKAITLSVSQVQNLARQLDHNDANELLDKRRGQLVEYRMTPRIKAELIQQFVVDIVSKGRTSGRQIAAELDQRCQVQVSERTIRQHLINLGLPSIKNSLPKLLSAVKKTPEHDS